MIRMTGAICILFFLSGVAALLFESLWFVQASLALGNSVWASALVLAGFMGGLGVGNAVAIRQADRWSRPLLAYLILEVAVGGTGYALVWLLPALSPLLAPLFGQILDNAILLNGIRLALSFLLMLVPTTAMGMTLPLLVRAIHRQDSNFGRALGNLYGWNTLGAMVGALIGELGLVASVGIRGAAAVAGALNILAALLAFRLDRRQPNNRAVELEHHREAPKPFPPAVWLLAAAAALSGAVFLALEVVWFRLLLIFHNAFSWNFSLMLAVVLAGIGSGGLIAARFFKRLDTVYCLAGPAALLAGTWVAGGYFLAGPVLRPGSGWSPDLAVLPGAISLMFPVALASGVLFTLLGQAIQSKVVTVGRSTAVTTLANTGGAMVGSLAGAFMLIPAWGIEQSLFILAAAYGGVAILTAIALPRPPSVWRMASWSATIVFVVALGLFPFGRMADVYLSAARSGFEAAGEHPVVIREGLTETIQYLRRELLGVPYYFRMVTNNHSMSATDVRSRRYMSLFAWLPGAVHPAPRRALLICFGVGTTAGALTDIPGLQSVDVVDISRDVLELGSIPFPNPGMNPLLDPRVRTVVEDGRFFLQTTPNRYDIITAEPPPPKHAGIASLYSREYFHLVRDRLADGGIVSYWLPVYQLTELEARAISAGFLDAFPEASLWTGAGLDWMLVGIKPPLRATTPTAIDRLWTQPATKTKLDALLLSSPAHLGATFITDGTRLRDWIGTAPPLTDDHPKRLASRETDNRPDLPVFIAFMNSPSSAEDFSRSGLIQQFFPEPYRQAALRQFPRQVTINAVLSTTYTLNLVPYLHRHLDDPEVVNAVFWMLKSDAHDARAIVTDNLGKGLLDEGVYNTLALSALIDRDLPSADRWLANAQPSAPSVYLPFRIYFRLRLGDVPGARQLARQLIAGADTDRPAVEDYLIWVFGVFGQTIDFPLASGTSS